MFQTNQTTRYISYVYLIKLKLVYLMFKLYEYIELYRYNLKRDKSKPLQGLVYV